MFHKSGYIVSSTALFLAVALGGCATHGPGGVAYDSSSAAQGTGATSPKGGEGSVSGGGPTPSEKAQRGNTPPGFDREGHGPAAGAIVDPSGVVTGRKP